MAMIRSFANNDTAKIWKQQWIKKIPREIQRLGLRKLIMLHRAVMLDDLRIPPGNHLEKLTGNRKGFWSIRINNQYRVCFRWVNGDAYNVEIIDYH